MYLSILEREKKKLFYQLAVAIASVDCVCSDEEKIMLNSYCKEMDLKYPEIDIKPIDEILQKLNEITNIQEKKIIIFEVVGLVLADKICNAKEEEVLRCIEKVFDMDINYTNKCKELIVEYLRLQEKINTEVL
ncbi:MAG: hypothetical protein U0L79_09635 [Lachnospiraceae bacterium]|nr:hypothetical protein [Lachnospiraceae bacterium]